MSRYISMILLLNNLTERLFNIIELEISRVSTFGYKAKKVIMRNVY